MESTPLVVVMEGILSRRLHEFSIRMCYHPAPVIATTDGTAQRVHSWKAAAIIKIVLTNDDGGPAGCCSIDNVILYRLWILLLELLEGCCFDSRYL